MLGHFGMIPQTHLPWFQWGRSDIIHLPRWLWKTRSPPRCLPQLDQGYKPTKIPGGLTLLESTKKLSMTVSPTFSLTAPAAPPLDHLVPHRTVTKGHLRLFLRILEKSTRKRDPHRAMMRVELQIHYERWAHAELANWIITNNNNEL